MSTKYSKTFLQRRLELLAMDTGWNVTGPVHVAGRSIVGRVFLQKAPAGNRWRIVEIVNDRGGEHNISDTLTPSELVEWMNGAMWVFEQFNKAKRVAEPTDPREPDYSRSGVFINHNCWRCDSGRKPCIKNNPRDCDTLHARND